MTNAQAFKIVKQLAIIAHRHGYTVDLDQENAIDLMDAIDGEYLFDHVEEPIHEFIPSGRSDAKHLCGQCGVHRLYHK